MQSLDTAPHRRAQISVLERKRVDETLKPFVGPISGWNAKAAHLRVRAVSAYSSEEERSLARLESGALLAEIRHLHSDFRSAVKGEPPHSRLDDVIAALERLIDQLQRISDGYREESSPRR